MEERRADGGPASLKRLVTAVDGFVAQLQCAICLCAYANPSSLPCNHCFCEECIHRALELKPVCPICKAPAKKRKLRYDSMIQQLLHATEILNAPVEEAIEKKKEEVKKQGEDQEMKAEDVDNDAVLLLEEKPMPSISFNNSTGNGTSAKPNGIPESAKNKLEPKQNGHRARIDSETVEAAERTRRRAKAKQPADAVTNGNKSVGEDESEEKQADERLVDEVQPESIGSASTDDNSEEAKSEKPTTRPTTRRRQGMGSMVSTFLSGTRRAEGAAAASETAAAAKGKSEHQASAAVATVETSELAKTTKATETAAPLSEQYPLNGPFAKSEVVDVVNRTWRGINKSGGAARIMKVNSGASVAIAAYDRTLGFMHVDYLFSTYLCSIADNTYNVKYLLEQRVENNVPDYFIKKPNNELTADVTPGRTVKQRQRRPTKYDTLSSEEKLATSLPTGSARGKVSGKSKGSGKRKRSEMVFLSSGYDEKGAKEIEKWSKILDAEIVGSWTDQVTHLIVKCVAVEKESDGGSNEGNGGGEKAENEQDAATGQLGTPGKRELFSDTKRSVERWVKIRSMKYLKALVGGRWIVSEEWLQACAAHGGHVSEADFEADGHLKGRNIYDAVRRSRKRRQENLQLSPAGADPAVIGTKLFEDFCFHLVGDFLSPMPPQNELDTLLSIGGGKRIRELSNIAGEMAKEENQHRRLVIVSDRINPVGLRNAAKHLRSLPEVKVLSNVAIVNYQWVLNSISEANLRPLK